MLEACGLKGHRIGGAQISPRHANFIENADGARSDDAIALMAEARRRAREHSASSSSTRSSSSGRSSCLRSGRSGVRGGESRLVPERKPAARAPERRSIPLPGSVERASDPARPSHRAARSLIGFAIVAGAAGALRRSRAARRCSRCSGSRSPERRRPWPPHVRAALAPLEGRACSTLDTAEVDARLGALPEVSDRTYDRASRTRCA